MQYDPSTIEKLKQLHADKKAAVLAGDYEKAIKITNGIERMKQIGIKLNELVGRKKNAIDKHDYDLAKKLKEEVELLRETVLGARLIFEDTPKQANLSRQWSRREVQKIVETDQNKVFERIQLTTEIALKDPKNRMDPELDKDKVFTQEEIHRI